jgi:ABC-type Fe3+-hydroxamate transport system substrate-binding protein
MMRTSRSLLLVLLAISLVTVGLSACGKATPEEVQESVVPVEAVTLNRHPASLEGKTVVLRWNGKPNGDKLLNRVGELLVEQVQGVKVIKLWETDPGTAISSDGAEVSVQIADKIAAMAPDLVIASQCD